MTPAPALRHTADDATARNRADRRSSVVTVAAVSLGLAVGFAPVYFGTLTVFLRPVSEEFGWGRAQASLGGVISMLGQAVGAIVVGRLIDRWGAMRIIPPAVALLAAMIVVQSQIQGAFGLFVLVGFLIGLAGAATTPPGYVSILARMFHDRLGLALGLAGAGMGIGHIITPIVAQAFISHVGWRGAYLGMATIVLVGGLTACAIVAAFGLKGRSVASVKTSTEQSSGSVRVIFIDPRFWRLAAMVLLVSVFTMGISIHLVPMLRDAGVAAGVTAGSASLAGIGVLLGRLISGALIDRFQARLVAACFFALASVGALLLTIATADSLWMFFAAGLLVGFSMGAEGDFLPFFVRRYFTVRSFGTIFGVLFFIHSLGGVIGPLLFGLTFDSWSTYTPALVATVVALTLASILVISLGPYRKASDLPSGTTARH